MIPLSEFGLMTVKEVARYHGCTRMTVWRWIVADLIPVVPVGHGVLIRRDDCERFVKPPIGRPRGAKDKAKRRQPQMEHPAG